MFIDSSTNNFEITAFGDVTVSNSVFKYGGGSAYFDGNGDSIRINSNAAFSFDGDFTIEGWYNFSQVNQFQG